MISLFQELPYNCQLNLENKEEKRRWTSCSQAQCLPKKTPHLFQNILYPIHSLYALFITTSSSLQSHTTQYSTPTCHCIQLLFEYFHYFPLYLPNNHEPNIIKAALCSSKLLTMMCVSCLHELRFFQFPAILLRK
jgi:hypothetical protein